MLEPLRIPGLGNNTGICSGAFNHKNACFFTQCFVLSRAIQRTHMKMLMGWGAYMVNYETGFAVQTLKVDLALFIFEKKINSTS